MTTRDEWIAERAAIIIEGNTERMKNGGWYCPITDEQAIVWASKEYDDAQRRSDKLRQDLSEAKHG